MAPAGKFVTRSIKSGVPANCFTVIDTHSDAHTGELQWGGGLKGVRTATAGDVLSKFCGKDFLQSMQAASKAAGACVHTESPGWYNDSPYFRGGWRGIFVASCAPAVRVKRGFDGLKHLVAR